MERTAVFARHLASEASPVVLGGPVPVGVAAAGLMLFHPLGQAIKEHYDYIIVGAGSSGATLASDLAKRLPHASVLLIEAGGTNQFFKVRSPFITCPTLQNSELDWAYRTTPQPKQQNRQSYWPRGRALGGSSTINFMLHVRGDPKGYDEWANKHGCGPEWSFKACEEFFIALENYNGQHNLPGRGKRGAIQVRDIRDEPTCFTRPVLQAFVDGCAANGVPESPDYNGPVSHIGASMSQTSITPDGHRCDTASAYLFNETHGALRHCANISVLTDAQVAKLLMVDGPRCAGVVLCSGHTAHLESKGINVVKNLPGVGRGMKDHIMIGIAFECKPSTPIISSKNPFQMLPAIARHLVFGDGVLSQSWVQAMAFARSTLCDPDGANDMQIHFIPLLGSDEELNKKNFGIDRAKHIMPAAKDVAYGLTLLPSLLQAKSEGFIELRSADPREHPVIEPNYLQHPDDLEVMVQTFELCRKVARSMQVTELVDETVPHPVESREYMAHKLARDAVTIYHPTSTCKMGPADRPMSVLDPATLRVWGVQGLRVVDCSSMPELPAANTNVPAIMLGLKAAKMIADAHTR